MWLTPEEVKYSQDEFEKLTGKRDINLKRVHLDLAQYYDNNYVVTEETRKKAIDAMVKAFADIHNGKSKRFNDSDMERFTLAEFLKSKSVSLPQEKENELE